MPKWLAAAALVLMGCGSLTEPRTRYAYVDAVELPVSLSADSAAEVTFTYGSPGCWVLDEVVTQRTSSRLTIGVVLRDEQRDNYCLDIITWSEVTVPIEPPFTLPFEVTFRRWQGDTTYVIPAREAA